LVAFDINMWFEYVPSKENVSDGPSRGADELVADLGSKFVEAMLPAAADLFSVVRSWRAAQRLQLRLRRQTRRMPAHRKAQGGQARSVAPAVKRLGR
jgi:hypothetical protein